MTTTTFDQDMMQLAMDEAIQGVSKGDGGPFGAVIVQNGKVISRGHNLVLSTNDPTAHAEIVAIRAACAKLSTFSLHDCVIYSSCQPCPMCFSAIHWAKIPRCIYSATKHDAADVGFDDAFLYQAIRGETDLQKCAVDHMPHPDSCKPFDVYREMLKHQRSSLY